MTPEQLLVTATDDEGLLDALAIETGTVDAGGKGEVDGGVLAIVSSRGLLAAEEEQELSRDSGDGDVVSGCCGEGLS